MEIINTKKCLSIKKKKIYLNFLNFAVTELTNILLNF